MKIDKDIAQKPIRLIRRAEMLKIIGMKHSMVYKWIKDGTFPAPIQLGERAVAWNSHEIDQWVRNKINGAGK